MTKGLRKAAAIGLAAMISAGPAMADTTIGMYQTPDRKMDFELSLCGPKETYMCVKLLDARDSARVKRTIALIGKYIAKDAKPAGKNRWKGQMHYAGYDMSGTLKMSADMQKFEMTGCLYIVACETMTLVPALEETAAVPAQ